MPKVSVIIPCYNQGQYLDEAVDSVLNQTFQDFEIIIVNDGSTDKSTVELLKTYQKPKTKVIHTTNQGLPSARNNGIKGSVGEYILPLDADDKIGNTYLEKAVKILAENPKIGIIHCEVEFFGVYSGKWQLPPCKFPDSLVRNVIVCASLYRKTDWEKVGGYKPIMKYGWEDFEFWLSLIETGVEVYQIPETLFYYRKKESSMVASMQREHYVYSYEQIFLYHRDLYLNNLPLLLYDNFMLYNQLLNTQSQLLDMQNRFDQQNDVHIKLKTELRNVYNSVSWKVTGPLRGIKRLLKMGVDNFKKIIKHLKIIRIKKKFAEINWYRKHRPTKAKLFQMTKQEKDFSYRPLISLIMPVYNVKAEYLEKAIQSITKQEYSNWELCIVDDASPAIHIKPILNKYSKDTRIKIIFLEKNVGIGAASNQALSISKGEFVALIDNDDMLMPAALFEVVKLLQEKLNADFIYTDNCMIDKNDNIRNLSLKPDWSPEFFLSTCYVTHLRVFRHSLIKKLNGFSTEYNGAQDIELICRVIEKTERIEHLSKVLYCWRITETSVTQSTDSKPYIIDNSIKAYDAFLTRKGLSFNIEWPDLFKNKRIGAFKINFNNLTNKKVSIVIIAQNKIDIGLIEEIRDNTKWDNFDINLFISSCHTSNIVSQLSNKTKIFIYKDLSEISPLIAQIDSEYIVFLSQFIKTINNEWLKELIGYLEIDPQIGAVGGKIIANQNTIVHGAYLFMEKIQTLNYGLQNNEDGFWFNNVLPQNYSAVSNYCMATRKKHLKEVSGIDFAGFGYFADIDYCLKLRQRGYRVVYNPWCEVIIENEPYISSLATDYTNLIAKYGTLLGKDPYYNCGFSQKKQYAFAKK